MTRGRTQDGIRSVPWGLLEVRLRRRGSRVLGGPERPPEKNSAGGGAPSPDAQCPRAHPASLPPRGQSPHRLLTGSCEASPGHGGVTPQSVLPIWRDCRSNQRALRGAAERLRALIDTRWPLPRGRLGGGSARGPEAKPWAGWGGAHPGSACSGFPWKAERGEGG